MKRVLLALLFFLLVGAASQAQTIVPIVGGVVTADVNRYGNFKVFVTSNITSVVFATVQTPVGGQIIYIILAENATGGFTVAFGGNIQNACVVNTSANATTVCQFEYDATNTNWYGVNSSSGGGGGGLTPTGPTGSLQTNGSGVLGAAGCIDLSGVLNCTDSVNANSGLSASNSVVQSGGTFSYTYTSGSAVTASQLVKLDATGRIIPTATSDTSGILGMASGGAGSSGSSVLVVISGPVPMLKADGSCTIGQSLINSASVAGDVRCTSSPGTAQVIGISQQLIGAAGTIKATIYPQVSVTSSSGTPPAGSTGAVQINAGGGAFGAIGCLDASSTLTCTDAVVFSGGMSSNTWCPISSAFCATMDSSGNITAGGNVTAGGSGASALFLPATTTPSTVSGNVDIHAPSSISSGSLDVTWLGAPCNGSLTSTLNDATHMTVTCGASTSNAFSSITNGTNSNAGTFTATGNTWDFSGATFKLPSATAPAYVTTGAKFTTNGGCSETLLKGGGSAGNYTSGTTGTCTVTVTMGSGVVTPPNGWMCFAINFNSPATVMLHTGGSATTAIFSGTTTSGDQVGFWCGGY